MTKKLDARIPVELFNSIYRLWRETSANKMTLNEFIVGLLEKGAAKHR
jgi:hypothetical protein